MPRPADRLIQPMAPPRRRPVPVVALAIAASVLIHAAALASAIGLWGDHETTAARPIEVVLVTMAQPGRAPAPAPVPSAAAPAPAERAGPPTVAMPIASPADPARVAPPAAAPSPPPLEPAPVMAVADASVPLSVARVERLDDAQPNADPLKRVPPPAPVPVSRPRAAASAPPAGSPAARRTVPAEAPPASVAALAGPAVPAGAETSRQARFALGSPGNPIPRYPQRARQRGWQGRVVLRVTVDAHGRPTAVDIRETSGHTVLDTAARDTVSTWTFRPALRAGDPVAGEAIVPVVFRLN